MLEICGNSITILFMNFYLNSVAEEKNTAPTSMLSEAVVCQLTLRSSCFSGDWAEGSKV